MKHLFTYLLCLTSIMLQAQDGFLPGYVITNKGDTIKGKVRDRKFVNGLTSWQKIEFIDSLRGRFAYEPEEIKEYGRKGRPKYKTLIVGVESKMTFVEVSEEGPVILYSYYRGSWGGAGNAITIKPKKKESKPRQDLYLSVYGTPYKPLEAKERAECFLQFQNKPNSLMQWRPRDYKQTAKIFFADAPEILKLLEEGSLDEDDIFLIVKKYNADKKKT